MDPKGAAHIFRGVNEPSMEWNCGNNPSQVDYQIISQVWKGNVVRLPLNQDCWISDSSNPSYDSTYASTVDQQIQYAEQYGMDIILDLHWSDKGSFSVGAACLTATGGTGNCQQAMADSNSLTFWQQVAARYKGDQHVLFELYNEPFVGRGPNPPSSSWDIWLNGGNDSADGFTVVGMQKLYDTVRGTGANNLVLIGGLYWADDLSGISTHKVTGTNIVYAVHAYQNDSGWTSAVTSVSQNDPVFITEFGDRSGSCATATDTTVIQYANKQGSGVPAVELSWTAWAFYPASNLCTFPSLIKDSDTYGATQEGAVVQAALLAGP